MYRSLDWYIQEAKTRSGVKSDRKLCELLDISDNMITAYKKGALPTDDTMMRICKIAQLPPWQGLLDLCMWRTKDQPAHAVYEFLQKKIAPSVIICLTVLSLLASPPALAAGKVSSWKCASVYYGKQLKLFLKKMAAIFAGVMRNPLCTA